jgi:hypothetical protein
MPRSGGVYTLPAGNPVVTLTTISSTWANTTMSDIATALTGSLPTDGSAPMSGVLRLADGVVGAPGLTWASETTSGWYRIGLNQFGFAVAGVAALTVNANRGWTIPTPAAGLSLNLTIAATGVNFFQASDGSGILQMQTDAGHNYYFGTTTANALELFTNNSVRLLLSSAGNVTINAPTSGTALTVNGAAAGFAIVTAGTKNILQAPGGTTTLAIQQDNGIQAGGAMNLFTSGGQFAVGTTDAQSLLIATNAAIRMTLNSTGNVTIAAPTSGVALTATGIANQNTISVNGSSTSGQSFGIAVSAGTTSADYGLLVDNVGGHILCKLIGDGSFDLGFNGSTNTITGSAAGAVIIAQPTSNVIALTVTGVASNGSYAVEILSGAIAGSRGLYIHDQGSGSTGFPLVIDNTIDNLFTVSTDGGVQVGQAPTGGNQGLGTINVASGYFVNGANIIQTGTFTGTLTGLTTSPTTTIAYTISGKICTLVCTTAASGTSNSTSFTITGLPAACQNASSNGGGVIPCAFMQDNTVTNLQGAAIITAGSGTIVLALSETTLTANRVETLSTAWTAAGTKGITNGWTITYSLN